jgi:hypothetical protein
MTTPADTLIYALITGVLLSPIYGIGSWLKWQEMKLNTILPKGAWTGRYGGTASFLLKGGCFLVLFLLFKPLGWWLMLSIIVMWFVSGWIATLIERKAYASEYNMDLIVFAAEQYTKDMDTESAAHLMSQAAPKWWIKLMPQEWQSRLHERLAAILLPDDSQPSNEA